MVRSPRNEKPGIKKGAWSYEEDKKLIAYINKYGIWNWSQMPKFAGLSRSGKSCRLRWMNYLRPDVKVGNFTEEEDAIIIDMHEKLGSRWSAIAKQLPGRTDNDIKNNWHTRLKKRLLVNNNNSVNTSSKTKAGEIAIQKNSHGNNATEEVNDSLEVSKLEGLCHVQESPNLPASVSSSSANWDFEADTVWSTELNTLFSEIIGDFDEIFWKQPFLMEDLSMHSQFDNLLWSQEHMNSSSSYINDFYSDCIMYNV